MIIWSIRPYISHIWQKQDFLDFEISGSQDTVRLDNVIKAEYAVTHEQAEVSADVGQEAARVVGPVKGLLHVPQGGQDVNFNKLAVLSDQ